MGWWFQVDLRKQKTEEAIRDAFLHLRATRPLERVTVRELCDSARIGKATFYLHYHDVYELSERMQADLVQTILDGIPHPQLILTDTPTFTREFSTAVWSKKNLIDILFEGAQASVLPSAIDDALQRELEQLSPDFAGDERAHVVLTFQVYGAYYAFMRYSSTMPADKVIALTSELAEGLWTHQGDGGGRA